MAGEIKIESDVFELKFSGGSIVPSNVGSGELGLLLKDFEDSLVAVILRDYDELDAKNVLISLVEIEESSLKLRFRPRLREVVFAALTIISSSIENNAYGNLPVKAVESLQTITRFCKAKKCFAELRDNPTSEKPIATITSDTKIEIPQTAYLFGETTIYGKVLRVGGVEPKVQLKINDANPILYCPISEEQAKIIGKNLYSEIGFKGTAKWYIADYSIVDFKIEEIISYKKEKLSDAIGELKSLIGKHWEDVSDVEGTITQYRNGIA